MVLKSSQVAIMDTRKMLLLGLSHSVIKWKYTVYIGLVYLLKISVAFY